jgi:hypothetical protein
VGTIIKETNEGIVDLKKVYGSMLKIATFIYFELVSHHIDSSSKVVMESIYKIINQWYGHAFSPT